MKVISDNQREQMNEMLHDELVQQIKEGDSTVLFEIIENLNSNTVYYSLSDEGQKKLE